MPNHKKHKSQPTKQISKRLASDDEIRSTTDESVRSADSLSLDDEKLTNSKSMPGHINRLSSSSIEDFPTTRSRDTSHLSSRGTANKPALTERQQLNLLLKSTAEGQAQVSPNPLSLPSHKKQLPRVHRRNAQGETHLHLACIRGELNTAIDLVAQGAQVNSPDNAGWTPLHEAANYGHTPLVELLLRCGANANAKSIDRETALHDAAISGHEEICKLLLSYGADPLNINKDGKTAIDLTDSPSIKSLLSNPKPIRKLGRKSKKSKLALPETASDNEGSSSVFYFPAPNSPSEQTSPTDTPLTPPPEKPTLPPPEISEALDDYTSKWPGSGESSTDETRETELSPSIISKCTKITSEHPKMMHNRNSNNSEKKKKKRTKDLHHHKISKSTARKLFSQEEETPTKSPDIEKSHMHSPMHESIISHEYVLTPPMKIKTEGVRKKKSHSSPRITTHKDTPHLTLSDNISKSSTTSPQSLKPAAKPQIKLPGKPKRAGKRTAEFLSDTTSEEDHNMMQVSNASEPNTQPQQYTEEGKPLSDDLSWVKHLPPCKRKRPVVISQIVQRRCEKPNPTILPTNFEEFLSYRQDYASNRIDPSAPLSHSYNFPPELTSLYEEQERSRLSIIKRHIQEREQLQLTFEQELLRVYQRSARATPPPSVCTVLSSAGRLHQPTQTPSTPLDPPTQPYDSNLLKGLVQDIYDKFNKLIQNLTARQKMDCDALYFTQVDTWDSRVQSLVPRLQSESSISDH